MERFAVVDAGFSLYTCLIGHRSGPGWRRTRTCLSRCLHPFAP